jgi:putative ABC transport system permease protein
VIAMKKLNKMLLREVKNSRAQFIAAVTVVLLGISMFTAALISYRNLKSSKDFYYEQYKFLDYYAVVKGISGQVVDKIRTLEDVKEAEGRFSLEAGADMGEDKRVTVRLLSLPQGRRPAVNDLYVVQGSYQATNKASCLVSKSFAEHYKLTSGSTMKINLKNKKYELSIEGIVQSPEFIYEIKSAASPAPSPEDFGIVYIKESSLKEMIGTEGLYNEVHVSFKDSSNSEAAVKNIEEVLKPYGFITGVSRKDQLSNTMISNEIEEMKEIAVMFPALFLGVAAMIIYIMLRRIISNQRTSIGVMKALGYKNKRILWHYMLYALLIALIGFIPGTVLGMGLGMLLTTMYNKIFSIPVMKVNLYGDLFAFGTLLSIVFCLTAGYNAAKRVLKIEPAEAMRSEAPAKGRRIMLENIKFIWNRLSFGTKMSIRNIFRNRKRALLTAFSTSLTIMFIMVALFFMDSINYILKAHFTKFQKQDYKISYSKPETLEELRKLEKINGIEKKEPILELPSELKRNGKKEDTLIIGLSKNSSLYSLFDEEKRDVAVPKEGILVAETLADRLALKAGDTIAITLFGAEKLEKNIKVSGIVKQYAGFNCYMNIEELQALTGLKDSLSGALLKVEAEKDKEVKAELLKDTNISTVESRVKSYENFKGLMKFMYVFFIVMIVFGAFMGFSIIFNTTVINITERKRELASLKVLGYSKKEIQRVVFKENIFLGIFALIPGLAIGRIMCSVFGTQFSNEFFTFEIYISPATYTIAALSMFLFIIMAQHANRKRLVGLDMVEVLKDREG